MRIQKKISKVLIITLTGTRYLLYTTIIFKKLFYILIVNFSWHTCTGSYIIK
jgi:hypothetical protein